MDKIFAVLGDIHANLDALEVVLEDCRSFGVTDFLCTGDVVGYNACPHECLDIVRGLNCPVVKGNHDHYVSSEQNLSDFHPNAAAVVEWTRRQLSDEEMTWLRDMPFTITKLGVTLVHSTMDNPEGFGYVFDHLQAETNFTFQKTPLCFHGHTHCPLIYEKQMNGIFRIDAEGLPKDTFRLVPGRKYFINVGSVGQPRDGDSRSAYVIYNLTEKSITFRRIPYDIGRAQERIRAAGLPERLAQRLEIGQ